MFYSFVKKINCQFSGSTMHLKENIQFYKLTRSKFLNIFIRNRYWRKQTRNQSQNSLVKSEFMSVLCRRFYTGIGWKNEPDCHLYYSFKSFGDIPNYSFQYASCFTIETICVPTHTHLDLRCPKLLVRSCKKIEFRLVISVYSWYVTISFRGFTIVGMFYRFICCLQTFKFDPV